MKNYYTKMFVVFILGLLTLSSVNAQGIKTYGIDHVGVTVANLADAANFFKEIFGCAAVTKIGPFPIKTSLSNDRKTETKARASAVTIQMLRCGSGANIELFAYSDSTGRAIPSDHEDIGAQHIAFYVDDVKAGEQYLKKRGYPIVGHAITMASGDTAGETWVHFMTPFGLEMELVESNKGKAYEHHQPKLKLWSPKHPSE